MADETKYASAYTEDNFWEKVTTYAKSAGKEVLEKSLWLFYAAQNPDTPAWAKSVIYGALGYFIFPIDAIADFTPLAGYSDDLGVLALAVATVVAYIDDEVKAKAAQKLKVWFGD